MREEGERELEAGVEEEVDEVDEALSLQRLVILRREVAQRGETEQRDRIHIDGGLQGGLLLSLVLADLPKPSLKNFVTLLFMIFGRIC